MQKPRDYSFEGRKALSREHDGAIEAILLDQIPGARQIIAACRENDKNGTDYWVEMAGGYFVSVDLKLREEDFAAKTNGARSDDLALETWSVVEKQLIGWTRNPSKRTDYILWYWIDTQRWCLVPFPLLCRVFQDNWEAWCITHKDKVHQQSTQEHGGYHSECVFVPRREVWAALYSTFSGSPKNVMTAGVT